MHGFKFFNPAVKVIWVIKGDSLISYFSLSASPKRDLWITFELNNRLRSKFALENDQKFLKELFFFGKFSFTCTSVQHAFKFI